MRSAMCSKIMGVVVFSMGVAGFVTSSPEATATPIQAVAETRDDALGPQVLVTAEKQEAVLDKIENAEWARAAYGQLKERVDKYVQKMQAEPEWATARLMMNWDTHYVQAVTKGSRTIGGKGRAPIPTPRFAGARDWKTDYVMFPLDELVPYNDQDGRVFLPNRAKGGEPEWVDPSITGHAIEKINMAMMALARDAAFVYWVEKDEKYADLAASILWPFMHGLSYTKPPVIVDHETSKSGRIIGTASYEVIHDGILESIAVTYDFMRDYIEASDEIDADIIEQGIKVFVDRIIAGGGAQGNWNMHQASKIAYGGLALQPNEAYEDGKGREYYVDVVLNAQLPQQKGITHVMRENLDQETGIWPEAAGYAFDAVANVVELSYLLSDDPAGKEAMRNPVLTDAVLVMRKLMHPNRYSNAVGDTGYTRIDARAYELMTAWAVSQGDTETAETLSAALQQEIADGAYSRSRPKDVMIALTKHLAELPEADPSSLTLTPTYFAEPLNIMMLRNMPASGDTRYALGAAMFGTKGGHMHTNGMAVEIYGMGEILGVDPGRGTSYWQPDHGQYYRALPSHNTVLVNGGEASYPSHHRDKSRMLTVNVESVEPAFGEEASDPHLTYLTGSFAYPKPAAEQQRTLALVRIDDQTAFYFDVFRSKLVKGNSNEYHDWMYHAMADSFEAFDAEGNSLKLSASNLLTSDMGNAKGYDYFTNEQSVETDKTVRVRLPVEMNGKLIAMDVWMLGGENRQLFVVDSPANRGARHYVEEAVWDRLRPTLVVRQKGEASERPFVAVYEPYEQNVGAGVKSVEQVKANHWVVSGDTWEAHLKLNGPALSVQIEN